MAKLEWNTDGEKFWSTCERFTIKRDAKGAQAFLVQDLFKNAEARFSVLGTAKDMAQEWADAVYAMEWFPEISVRVPEYYGPVSRARGMHLIAGPNFPNGGKLVKITDGMTVSSIPKHWKN